MAGATAGAMTGTSVPSCCGAFGAAGSCAAGSDGPGCVFTSGAATEASPTDALPPRGCTVDIGGADGASTGTGLDVAAEGIGKLAVVPFEGAWPCVPGTLPAVGVVESPTSTILMSVLGAEFPLVGTGFCKAIGAGCAGCAGAAVSPPGWLGAKPVGGGAPEPDALPAAEGSCGAG